MKSLVSILVALYSALGKSDGSIWLEVMCGLDEGFCWDTTVVSPAIDAAQLMS
tara:strand:+ start:179 stop:337 length:159 start_codon:yes stop_codon:yes gene_type:complete